MNTNQLLAAQFFGLLLLAGGGFLVLRMARLVFAPPLSHLVELSKSRSHVSLVIAGVGIIVLIVLILYFHIEGAQ